MAQGFLITAPTVTGSHTDFSALLVTGSFPLEAIDGGIKSFPNGGGSLQAYTDKTLTTQLPISVIRFVTGASPDIQVRVLEPQLITGRQIYIRDDEAQLTQPPATAPFGRNAVISGSATKQLSYEMEESPLDAPPQITNYNGGVSGTDVNVSAKVNYPQLEGNNGTCVFTDHFGVARPVTPDWSIQ